MMLGRSRADPIKTTTTTTTTTTTMLSTTIPSNSTSSSGRIFRGRNMTSPRTGATSAPVNHDLAFYRPPQTLLSSTQQRHSISAIASAASASAAATDVGSSPHMMRMMMLGQLQQPAISSSSLPGASSSPLSTASLTSLSHLHSRAPVPPFYRLDPASTSMTGTAAGGMQRLRSSSLPYESNYDDDDGAYNGKIRSKEQDHSFSSARNVNKKRVMSIATASIYVSKARTAMKENDQMVYLDGPQIYSCAHCRTHLTSHDDIVSKSFHGRHGRAFLFDQAVNVTIGRPEDRQLITGLHSVCDIYCKRCKTMVGWTYAKAYEASQKYKENKFIIEKINLHWEESVNYKVMPVPAGERPDRWRRRSRKWGDEVEVDRNIVDNPNLVYEYRPPTLEFRSSTSVMNHKQVSEE